MDKIKKVAIFVSAGVIGLGIIFLVIKFVLDNKDRKLIPKLPDFAVLSEPIKEQLSLANKKARRNPTADNIGNLGMAYHSCAMYDLAAQCYQLAIRKDRSKWIWSYYLGYLDQEMGDARGASENFKVVIGKNPKVYLGWYYLGKAYENMSSGDLAEEAFNKIAYLNNNITDFKTVRVNYFPLPTKAKFELARIYLNTRRYDKAEKILTDIIQRNHTIGPVYRLLGDVYSAKGDSSLSRKYIIRAKDLPVTSPFVDTLADKLALMSRSELYLPKQIDESLNSANNSWSIMLINIALKYLPENKFLISKSIKYFLSLGTGSDALPYLDKHFNEYKNDFNEMVEVADLLFKKGFYLQSERYYLQAKNLKPENNELQASFALSYWKADKRDSAIMIMNKLYEKNKSDSRVLANEVDFMLKLGEKEKAKTFLSKLKQVAPSDPKVPKLTGMIAETEGNQKSAILFYEEAFKGDPSDLETTRKLGYLLIEQKLWRKAINMLRISLEQHPNEPFLLERLGTLLISCPDKELRNLKEGLELSERAFSHIASSSNILILSGKSLAMGYATLGDFQRATFYINTTLNIARDENMPQSYMEELMRLADAIKQFREKSR
jgi:tetratricopeptide (TPR) repeat protein